MTQREKREQLVDLAKIANIAARVVDAHNEGDGNLRDGNIALLDMELDGYNKKWGEPE